MLPRLHPLLLLGFAASLSLSASAQMPPTRLAVGFSYAAFAEWPIERLGVRHPPQQAAATPPSVSFGNVMYSAAMLGALGAVGGGFVGAGLNDTGDDLHAVIQGAIVGAWIGGGIGGATASGRTLSAFLGSAFGVAVGWGAFDSGPAGLLLAPLTHGLVTALFTTLVPPRSAALQ